MSSYTMVDLRGKIGVASATVPLQWEASVDASEISALTVVIIASAVSAGVTVLTPAVVSLEHSFDDGASWIAMTGLNGAVVTGVGSFLTSVSLTTGLVAPLIRITLTPPAGETVTVSKARKNRFLPGTLISFAGASFLGGTTVTAVAAMKYGPAGVFVDTFATYDTTTPANTRALPVIFVDAAGIVNTLTIRRGPAGVFVDTRVAHDTTTPANTRPVPTLAVTSGGIEESLSMDYGPAGVFTKTKVARDTTTPTNTRALPVIAVDTAGTPVAPQIYSAAFPPVSGLSLVLVATVWKEFIASTAAGCRRVQYVNESGYAIEVGFGAGGAEVSQFVLAEAGEIDILIPAGTRISFRCITSNTLPVFWWSAFA